MEDKHEIVIDGSLMEGGGQILRMSSVFSCLLRVPIKIYNIRGNRTRPGLRSQHLTGLELITQMSDCELLNGFVNSMWIQIVPRKRASVAGGRFSRETGTAGSIGLVLQNTVPFALLGCSSPTYMSLGGGTNAAFAPHIDWIRTVLFYNLRLCCGAKISCDLVKRGCFPQGGGKVNVIIEPIVNRPLSPIKIGCVNNAIDRVFVQAWGCGRVPAQLIRKIANISSFEIIKSGLVQGKDVDSEWKKDTDHVPSSGCGVIAFSRNSLGQRYGVDLLLHKDASLESLAETLVTELKLDASTGVDKHLEDNLILYMALAEGQSEMICCSDPSLHTMTAIYIAEQLSGAKFRIEPIDNAGNNLCRIVCDGIGFVNRGVP